MKKTEWLQNPEQLKPGDILLFPAPVKNQSRLLRFSVSILKFLQAMISHPHGHYGTAHAAICLRQDNSDNPLLAHVTSNLGYEECRFYELSDLYAGPYWVYRANDATLANKMVELASNQQKSWGIASGIKAYFASASPENLESPPKAKAQGQTTICSTFIAECVNTSIRSLLRQDPKAEHYKRYALPRDCMPKALEASLYSNEHYSLHCYSGDISPYLQIQEAIQFQLQRLQLKKGKAEIKKYRESSEVFNKAIQSIQNNLPSVNELDRALILVKMMQPYLSRHTGIAIGQTQSFAKVSEVLRNLGVFKRDLASVIVPESVQMFMSQRKRG